MVKPPVDIARQQRERPQQHVIAFLGTSRPTLTSRSGSAASLPSRMEWARSVGPKPRQVQPVIAEMHRALIGARLRRCSQPERVQVTHHAASPAFASGPSRARSRYPWHGPNRPAGAGHPAGVTGDRGGRAGNAHAASRHPAGHSASTAACPKRRMRLRLGSRRRSPQNARAARQNPRRPATRQPRSTRRVRGAGIPADR